MKGRLILILAGLVFFFNPCFYMFDVLPDFIGAALVMWGLSSFIYFDANLEGAHKSAKYLLWISVVKLGVCMWCMSGHRDYVMPFTFIASVLETIFMISMFRSLYLGAQYTLMRSKSEQSPKAVNEAFTMSFIFTIASRFLEFAPHISDILAQDAELDLSHKASFKMSAAQMKMYLLFACLVCTFILGVIFAVVTFKAWIKLIRDREYCMFLGEKYQSFIINDREEYFTRRISFAYLLLTVSLIFIPDFYIDGVNVIPSVVTVICLFFSSRVLCKLGERRVNVPLYLAALVSVIVNAAFMSRVHLGINYVYSVETFNREEFPLMTSSMCVVYSVIFSVLEALLLWGILNFCLSSMKNVFVTEKRKNGLAKLFVCRIVSAFAFVLSALSKVLTSVCGYLATNPVVTDYVKNKAFITSGKVYEQMMANPYVAQYESYVSVQTVIYVLSVLFALMLAVIAVNMKRATEGNDKQIG